MMARGMRRVAKAWRRNDGAARDQDGLAPVEGGEGLFHDALGGVHRIRRQLGADLAEELGLDRPRADGEHVGTLAAQLAAERLVQRVAADLLRTTCWTRVR